MPMTCPASGPSRRVAGIVVAVVAVLGCAGPASAEDVTGRTWRLVRLATAEGEAPAGVSLAFEPDGRVSGFAGCNRIMGSYQRHSGGVVIGPLASTRKLCPPHVMAFERTFVDALSRPGTSGRVVGGALRFSAEPAGEPVLVLE